MNAVARIALWLARRRDDADLARFLARHDDHLLRDIGLSRSDLEGLRRLPAGGDWPLVGGRPQPSASLQRAQVAAWA